MNLEEEIKEASSRIEKRKDEIESTIRDLDSKVERYLKWSWFFVILGAVVTVFAICIYVKTNDEKGFGLNLLGDFMAGTVASVWSLAGLFFIYVAFLGQKQQLLNQQLEIMYSQLEVKYTRLELAGQKEEMKLQNNTLKQQKFENTFFQLLANHNNIVNSIDLKSDKDITNGRDCFVRIFIELRNEARRKNGMFVSSLPTLEIVINAYNLIFKKYRTDIDHYFRNLYHMIKFISESDIEGKKQYTNFVRAQLSSAELALLFYNCISLDEASKFKPLIEEYSLLKNVDKSLIFNEEHFVEYNERAFK